MGKRKNLKPGQKDFEAEDRATADAQAPFQDEQQQVLGSGRQHLYRDLEQHWAHEAQHYGWAGPWPENVLAKAQAVLGASDLNHAQLLAKKAKNTMQVMLLGAWSRGKISGPVTELSLEKQVRQAESLVQMLEAKGQDAAAETQRNRLKRLQDQLQALRVDQA